MTQVLLIARTLGWSAKDVLTRMSSAEFALWGPHLERYPPGDFRLQRLVAVLISVVSSFTAQKSILPEDVAPDLFDTPTSNPEAEQERKIDARRKRHIAAQIGSKGNLYDLPQVP